MRSGALVALTCAWSATAIPPNSVCCSDANDPTACAALVGGAYPQQNVGGRRVMQCPNQPDGSCAFDNCVGGTGVDCEGVTQDINLGPMGTISVGIVRPTQLPGNAVGLKVSVGSILHDLCCINHPHGAFCDGSNYPIGATINLLGNANNNCACLMEWRKAAWNLLRGRYWTAAFPKGLQSSDLTPVPGLQRRSYLPKGSGTNYLSYKSTWGITEVKSTAALCAPSGTRLDCPSEDNNCKVPCFGVSCRACAFGCQRRHRKRWNKNGRNHAEAGDSDYCCSGKFKEVYYELTGTRYGVCQ